MEQYVLYMILKDICKSLDGSFKYSFNDMDSNGSDVVGIYIKGGETSEYRSLSNGKYYNVVNRVQFLIQGDATKDSLMKCLRLSSKIKNTLITTSNVLITASSKLGFNGEGEIVETKEGESLQGVNVQITKVDLLGEPTDLGKNEQGKPMRSINIRIKYEIGGN